MDDVQTAAFRRWVDAVAGITLEDPREAAWAFVRLFSVFRVESGPLLLSFSGGRTSGVMLRLFLDLGLLDRPDAHVAFANTGKEREETLEYVWECGKRWGVRITWLQYERTYWPKYKTPENRARQEAVARTGGRQYEEAVGRVEPGYRVVDFNTAARKGEPFANMIDLSGLPNFGTPHCSTELKTRVIKRWMVAQGCEEWLSVVGLRADEPIRIARMRAPTRDRWDNWLPLADLGITEAHVMLFWSLQPFDLQLRQAEGNCDLCFKKSDVKRYTIAHDKPDRALWWATQEARSGSVFRRNAIDYAKLHLAVLGQATPRLAENGSGDCVCHD